MKKVLIITYYWPPAGGPGVQRVLKFAKYLPQFGWQPIVLTVKDGEFIARDESLSEDIPKNVKVFKTSSIEPNTIYKRFVGMDQNAILPDAVLTQKDVSWKKKIANWIRMNLFIPDAKIGWKPFAVSEGKQIIKEEKPDIIFSTSPPPTVHLIAQKLSRLSNIPWVADFRDPWTNIHYYKNQSMTRLTSGLDKKLESEVLRQANRVTVVNKGFFDKTDEFTEHIISNGFDSDDLTPGEVPVGNKKFTIRYVGSFKIRQYVDSFFRILKEISGSTDRDVVKFEIIGNLDPLVKKEIVKLNLKIEFNFTGYMEHKKALALSGSSDLLCLFIGKSDVSANLLSGKVFEYLMVKKPILAYGPVGGAADRLLSSTGSGKLFDYQDQAGAKDFIFNLQKNWKENKSYLKFNEDEITKYERKALTWSLVNHFEELV